MTAPVLDAVQFVAPPLNPSIPGLFAATDWQNDPDNRFLHGVVIRGANYGGEESAGVWHSPWCAPPPIDQDERKFGERPDIHDRFDPVTVWAYDECDLTEPSRREVEERAAQVLRLEEQPMVEREFAARLLLDAGDPDVADATGIETRPNIKAALSYLEGEIAKTNTLAFLHVGAQWVAAEFGMFIKSGTKWVSPSGHTWIIGGGYVDGLENVIVATSQPFGWRDAPTTRTAIDTQHNLYAAVAERSVTIGYEALIAAVAIAP
jgi:hypothetical protein